MARQEGKSTGDIVRSLVQRYVQVRGRGAALRALWNRMQQNTEEAGAGPGDVDRAIRAVREDNQSESSPAEDRP